VAHPAARGEQFDHHVQNRPSSGRVIT
jgi:hypothetical protein